MTQPETRGSDPKPAGSQSGPRKVGMYDRPATAGRQPMMIIIAVVALLMAILSAAYFFFF